MALRTLATLLGLTFALGAGAGAVGARTARMWADQLVDVTTGDLQWAKTRVRVNVDHWEPSAQTGPHRHPGPTVIYVIDGEVEEVFPGGKTMTLRAGQGVWHPARTAHNVRNVTSLPARVLAVHLDPG